jgi:hypothetical protein
MYVVYFGWDEMKPTEETTEHAIRLYVQPARERGEGTVRIRVGNLQKELGWTGRTPSVFSTLKSQPFQKEAGVKLIEKRGGPASGGPSTTVEFIYQVLDAPHESAEPKRPLRSGQGLMDLYGIGAEAFKQLGGGEAYLTREREEFRFPTEDYPFTGRKK